jgi:hypothetical protein
MMAEDRTRIEHLEQTPWHLAKRILFRLAFCYLVLYYLPSVLNVIPGAQPLAGLYNILWDRAISWGLIHFFDIDPTLAIPHYTDSGDTLLAYLRLCATVVSAAVVATLWTVLDRRRPHYISLHGWLRVFARYALAFALFHYAFAKIALTQFSHLQSQQLAESYGQSSPMRLLWNFMGFSTPYTIFGGCAELLPAVLLLFRRTALLGSIIAFAVMLNVVMLNFCYDVPVKLYSLNLLLLALFLTLPEAQKLLRVFVLNRSTVQSNLRQPFFKQLWLQRAAVAFKIVILAIFLFQTIHSAISLHHQKLASRTPPLPSPLISRGFHWIQEYPYNK